MSEVPSMTHKFPPMRNYNIDESSTAKHVDELHSIRRAMMVSALPKRRMKRSKKHGIHRAGGLFSPPSIL